MKDRIQIPFSETYRGVGIHAFQPPHRVAVVKAAIDAVFTLSDPDALLAHVSDFAISPESRMFAAQKIESIHELAVENREARPRGVNREKLAALVAGLSRLCWIDRTHYGTVVQPRSPDEKASGRFARRDRPLSDADLEAA